MNPALQTRVITIPYLPRKPFIPFHERKQLDAVLICHRRAGKTIGIANDGQRKAIENQRIDPPPRYAWMFPTRVRAKDIAWERLKHFAEPIPGIKVIESELAIEYPNRARFTLYGADNSRGVGLWLDGIYYDEADEIPPKTVIDVAPALADFNGFTVHAGYLTGRHNLFKKYEEAKSDPTIFTMFLRASESGIYPQEVLDKQRKMMGDAAYMMQWELDVNAALANAIYGQEMDGLRKVGRIYDFAFDPSCPLYTFWDIGYSDYVPIWLVQLVGRDICVLDYFCRNREVPAFYAAQVRQWEQEYGAPVRMNYLPHDAASHEKTGTTYVGELRKAGLEYLKVVPRTPDVWLGINRLRVLLPRFYLHHSKCSVGWKQGEEEMPSGIDCLDYYEKTPDASSGVIRDMPLHNQYSHGADALRTFAEAERQGMIEGTSEVAEESYRRSHPIRSIKAGFRH
jgi:hypothetical protein